MEEPQDKIWDELLWNVANQYMSHEDRNVRNLAIFVEGTLNAKYQNEFRLKNNSGIQPSL